MSNLKFISVSGYGSTGSSAVVDLLQEIESCSVLLGKDCKIKGGEFRFIQDPDGLEDLCFNLTNCWSTLRTDVFIRRFIKYTNIIGRDPLIYEFGSKYDKLFNGKFFFYRDKFLKDIVDSTWNGYWFYHDFHERNKLEVFIEKLKRFSRKFGISKKTIRQITKKSDMYFVRSDINVYKYAKLFINNLFNEILGDSPKNNIVLDQLLLPYNRYKYEKLFDNLKYIIVERDPRDIYCDASSYNAYPITKDVNTFISWFESQRILQKNETSNDNVLFVQFEDLIFNYKNEVNKILKFLNIRKEEHNLKGTILRISESIKNTQIWKREEYSKYEKHINIIERKLSEYLYKF